MNRTALKIYWVAFAATLLSGLLVAAYLGMRLYSAWSQVIGGGHRAYLVIVFVLLSSLPFVLLVPFAFRAKLREHGTPLFVLCAIVSILWVLGALVVGLILGL